MADDDAPSDATVQMSAEQLKRLHAELAAQGRIAVPKVKPGAEAPAPEPELEPEPEAAFVADDGDQGEPAAEPSAAEPYAEEPYAEGPYVEEPYAEEPYAEEPYAAEEPAEEPYAEEPYVAEEAAAPPVVAPPVAKADKKAKAEKPAKPSKAEKARAEARTRPPPAAPGAEPQGGGALLVLGGIGALIAGISLALPVVSSFQGMGGELWPILGGTIGMAVGHVLVGLGMFGAVSRTNGVAALVGTLHLIAMAALTFYLLALFGVLELDGDIVPYAALIPSILPATAWLLSGIWGLAAGAGALGILHGITAFLGGGAFIALTVAGLAGAFGRDDDIAIALDLGGRGLVLVATILLAIAMFGRLRRTAD